MKLPINTNIFHAILTVVQRVGWESLSLNTFVPSLAVILSNYYDLPFNDILDWHKFSVILKEQDVYRLKQILKDIPDNKLVSLHKNLVKVEPSPLQLKMWFFFCQIMDFRYDSATLDFFLMICNNSQALNVMFIRYRSISSGIRPLSNMMHSIWSCMISGCATMWSNTSCSRGLIPIVISICSKPFMLATQSLYIVTYKTSSMPLWARELLLRFQILFLLSVQHWIYCICFWFMISARFFLFISIIKIDIYKIKYYICLRTR